MSSCQVSLWGLYDENTSRKQMMGDALILAIFGAIIAYMLTTLWHKLQ